MTHSSPLTFFHFLTGDENQRILFSLEMELGEGTVLGELWRTPAGWGLLTLTQPWP